MFRMAHPWLRRAELLLGDGLGGFAWRFVCWRRSCRFFAALPLTLHFFLITLSVNLILSSSSRNNESLLLSSFRNRGALTPVANDMGVISMTRSVRAIMSDVA